MRRRAGAMWATAGFVLSLAAAAGCGGTPGSKVSSSPTSTTTAKVKTSGFQSLGPVTLKVWSADNQDPGPEPAIKELTRQFEQKYPNVHVQLTFRGFTDYIKVIKLALAGNDGPDVSEGNQGYQIDGALVKAQLIRPLTPYVAAYHWDQWYSPATFQMFRFSEDGKTFGTGPIWGVGQFGQSTGVFANTQKLRALGISDTPPKTFADFDSMLARVRAKLPKGQPVITVGNKDGYEIVHLWGMLAGAYGTGQAARDWIFHKPGATFETKSNLQALQKLQAWNKAGYFGSDYNAVGENDAAAQFAKGTGVFYLGGNWQAQVIHQGLGANVQFYDMPPGPAGQVSAIGATSLPWHISSKTKHPDLAAAYIDYIINGANAAKTMYGQAQIPAVVTAPDASGDAYLTSVANGWKQLVRDGGLQLFPDWSSPSMYDTMGAAFQKLLAGKSTPQQVAAAMQADWAGYDKTLHG